MEKTIIVHGRTHVLTESKRNDNVEDGQTKIEQPNYLGTGMALCGVLRPGETLEEWKKRRK
jgi:hypothetical protein